MLSAEITELAQPWLDVIVDETRNRKCQISYGLLDKQQNRLHITIKRSFGPSKLGETVSSLFPNNLPFQSAKLPTKYLDLNFSTWISQAKYPMSKIELVVAYPWVNCKTLSDGDKGKLQILQIFFFFFNLNIPDDLVFKDYISCNFISRKDVKASI